MQTGSWVKRKLRVGFILNLSPEWMGGVNYFRNLLNLIVDYPDMGIEPVMFLPHKMDEGLLQEFPKCEIVRIPGMDKYSATWFLSRVSYKLTGKENYWEWIVKKYRIDVLSHSTCYVRNAKVISWIPDFQHKYLADLFSKQEVLERDRRFQEIANQADIVLLSSEDARRDFNCFFPGHENKAKVYSFVVPTTSTDFDAKKLRNKYEIRGKFFFIPNQFWKHKNHELILKALNHLKINGHSEIKVYCSGNTEDYRNREHFSKLSEYCRENDLMNQFIVLGRIPYEDVQELMQECHALINPSLFEGWSTMVEEAKSLGKKIILSDLPVHKEQNPPRGVFFDRYSSDDLAEKILDVWSQSSEVYSKEMCKQELEKRKRDAIEKYRAILDS